MNEDFEQLIERYKNISDKLNDKNISLDEAINLYEESESIYKNLNKKIEDAKIRIKNIRQEDV